MIRISTRNKGTEPLAKVERSNPNRSKLIKKKRNIRTWSSMPKDVKKKKKRTWSLNLVGWVFLLKCYKKWDHETLNITYNMKFVEETMY